jgi:transcriptional regulator with XRE-family HTH domain
MGDLYTKIKSLCDGRDISVSRLCSDLGISRTVLSELNSGRTKALSAERIIAIAKYFGVPADFLLAIGPFAAWSTLSQNLKGFFYYIPISAEDMRKFGIEKEHPEECSLETLIQFIHLTVERIELGEDADLIVILKFPWNQRSDQASTERGIDDVRVALFGGDGEVTDEMWQEVMDAVEFIKFKRGEKKDGKP